jgi:hypothetical protein
MGKELYTNSSILFSLELHMYQPMREPENIMGQALKLRTVDASSCLGLIAIVNSQDNHHVTTAPNRSLGNRPLVLAPVSDSE